MIITWGLFCLKYCDVHVAKKGRDKEIWREVETREACFLFPEREIGNSVVREASERVGAELQKYPLFIHSFPPVPSDFACLCQYFSYHSHIVFVRNFWALRQLQLIFMRYLSIKRNFWRSDCNFRNRRKMWLQNVEFLKMFDTQFHQNFS